MMRQRFGALLAAALLLSACSSTEAPSKPGSDRESAPADPPASTSAPPMAHGSLAECLESHGVPESGGPAAILGPPAGVDEATWDAAMKACASLAPGPAGP